VVPSASLRLGAAGRAPCAATSHTCLPIWAYLAWAALTCLMTSTRRSRCSPPALEHLALGREEGLNSLQTSSAALLGRSPAGLAVLCGLVAIAHELRRRGGSCRGCGGCGEHTSRAIPASPACRRTAPRRATAATWRARARVEEPGWAS
jgi:hypothetical protein